LLLFAYGARRLPYSTVGVLQYIAPSLQLLCGVVVYHEHFGLARALGFALIWAALAIYAADGLWRVRSAPRLQRARSRRPPSPSEGAPAGAPTPCCARCTRPRGCRCGSLPPRCCEAPP